MSHSTPKSTIAQKRASTDIAIRAKQPEYVQAAARFTSNATAGDVGSYAEQAGLDRAALMLAALNGLKPKGTRLAS